MVPSDVTGDLEEQDGRLDLQESISQKSRSEEPRNPLLCIVKNFSTVWFTICMDTGVLSTLLHNFPYPSHWTRACAVILFVLNIVLCFTFGTIYLLHWVLYYKSTSKFVRSEAEEIALQACPAITWFTLAEDVQLICAQSWGHRWTLLAYTMWWIGVVWILAICVILYLHLVKYPSGPIVDKSLPTAVFIPIVGIFTAANMAGILVADATNATHISGRLSVSTVVIGFVLVGFGLGLASVMYAIYMHRLMTSGWPAYLKVPSMILTIGPCGQSASALIGLGNSAAQKFGEYNKGVFLTAEAATIVQVICILAAIFLIGFAAFWMCVDYYAIFEGLVHHKIHPSLFWWSTIFPVGTVVSALTSLRVAMDAPAFKVFAVIFFTFLFCIYVFNASFTIPMTLSGELLGLPKRKVWVTRGLKYEHNWSVYPRKERIS